MLLNVYDILPSYVVDMCIVMGDFADVAYVNVSIVGDNDDIMFKCSYSYVLSSYYAS